MSNKMIHVTKLSPLLLDEDMTVQEFLLLLHKNLGLEGTPLLLSSTIHQSKMGKILVTGTLSHKVLGIAVKQNVKTILTIDDYKTLGVGENLRREMKLVRDMIKLDLQAISFPLLQSLFLERLFQEVFHEAPILTHVNKENVKLYYNYNVTFQAFYAVPTFREHCLGSYKIDEEISQIVMMPGIIQKMELEELIESLHYVEKTGFIIAMAHDLIFHVFRRERVPFISVDYLWLKQQVARILTYALVNVSLSPIETFFDTKGY